MNIQVEVTQSKLNKGHAALWEHDWTGAVNAYNEVLGEAPGNPVAMASLGLAMFHQKRYRDALQLFQQLSTQYPEDPMPMERIARIYEREGLLHEAGVSFARAAELQLKTRDVERAIADYQSIIRIEPNNQNARSRLAMIYNKLGRKKEAVAEFIDLAAVVQRQGNPVKAMQIVEYALEFKPDSVEARNAAAILKNNGNLKPRDTVPVSVGPARMAQVREMEPTGDEASRVTNYDPLTEARLTALKEIAGILFEDPDNSRTAESAYFRTDQFSNLSAGDHLTMVSDRRRLQLHISESIDLQTAGKNEEAALELEYAIHKGLNLPAANYILGFLVHETDPQKSLENLQQAVKHPSYALASHLLIGDIQYAANQLPEAGSSYLHALMLADSETVPQEDVDELMQLYDPIFESQTFITQEKDLRNLCAMISGQLTTPDWRKHLKAAREQLPPAPEGGPPLPLAEMLMDSSSSQVVESLAEVRQLANRGKNRSAMEEAFKALSYAPTYLPLHIQIGEILVNEGRLQEAVEKFTQVARLYTVRGDTPQAIRLLTRVARLVPMDISVRRNLIDLLRSTGRTEDMIQQYMDLANVHYLLADLEQSRNAYHSALTLARQSRATREQSLKILNHLADIELQSLNCKEAIKVFEQMRSLSPMDLPPRIALVDLYYRLDMVPAALNEVDAYLKLLENENQPQAAEKFIDDILNEKPDNADLQKRMISYFTSKQKVNKAIEKLDALAEKLLVGNNVKGSIAVVEQIIALNPPNRVEYEKLHAELLKR